MLKLALIIGMLLIPTFAWSEQLIVEYNADAQIVGAHYSTSSNSSSIILDVDLKFEDGSFIKCVDNMVTAASYFGFSRWDLPIEIKYIPTKNVRCMRIKG